MAAMKKMAVLRLAPEFLAQLLQLPEGAEIIGAGVDDSRGVLRLLIEGAGYDVQPGDKIPEAPAASCRSSWAAPATVIDWNLPKAVQVASLGALPTAEELEPAVRSVVQSVADNLLKLPVREMPEHGRILTEAESAERVERFLSTPALSGLLRTASDNERPNGRGA